LTGYRLFLVRFWYFEVERFVFVGQDVPALLTVLARQGINLRVIK